MRKRILFLDDDDNRIRAIKPYIPTAVIVKTTKDCVEEIQRINQWDLVFLDHDLGGEIFVDSNREDTGMEVVRWVVSNKPVVDNFVIHTANPMAGDEMVCKLVDAGYNAIRIPFYLLAFNMPAILGETE